MINLRDGSEKKAYFSGVEERKDEENRKGNEEKKASGLKQKRDLSTHLRSSSSFLWIHLTATKKHRTRSQKKKGKKSETSSCLDLSLCLFLSTSLCKIEITDFTESLCVRR